MKNKFLNSIKIIFFGLVFGLSVGYIYAQTSIPPTVNALTPINVGTDLQFKSGPVAVISAGSLSGLVVFGSPSFLGPVTISKGFLSSGILNILGKLYVSGYSTQNDVRATDVFVSSFSSMASYEFVPLCTDQGGMVINCK